MGYPRAFHYAAVLALTTCVDSQASADQGYTGNNLLADCNDGSNWSNGACFGRVVGIINGMQMQALLGRQTPPFCVRDGVTNGQMVDVVTAWLRANPAKRDWGYEIVVATAASEAFACSKNK